MENLHTNNTLGNKNLSTNKRQIPLPSASLTLHKSKETVNKVKKVNFKL